MPANPLQGGRRADCHGGPFPPCCCCCGRTPCPAWSYFRLTKRDAVTGTPLAGALYTLYRGGREVVSDLSDPAGGLAFFPLAPGVYTLREVRPPAGYAPEEETHTVVVRENGGVTLDGRPAQGAVLYDLPLNSFRFPKTDGADGKPLAGAVFTLSDGRAAVSGADGEVSFGPLPPGRYIMKETAAPAGCLPNDREYGVAVAADGTITVDGTPLADFYVENEREPAGFAFQKKDAATGGPLAGAEFTLSDGQTAVSDAGGTVRFDNLAPGTYTLDTDMDYRAIISNMSASSASRATVDVTIPEGYTAMQVFERLEENGVCTVEELQDTAANYDFKFSFLQNVIPLGDYRRLEGYLFPDTYTFYVGDDPVNVLNKMILRFDQKFTDEMRQEVADSGHTIHEVVIVASLIEKETTGDDQTSISAVIWNRLASDNYRLLQIDATVQYILPERKEFLTAEDLAIDSPYNTYLYEGLPAGPIANPGESSIRAAMNPEDSNMYFYALGDDGDHHFFRTYQEQQNFIQSQEYYQNANSGE